MAVYEINALMRHADRRERGDWERTRTIAFTVAQSQSTKRIKPTDVLSFPWDDTTEDERETEMTADDLSRLERKVQQYLDTNT